MITIGIDTGGTCTDAVIYDVDNNTILAAGKTLTTKSNLEIGIANTLDMLPSESLKKAEMLSLSTTLATNACVENLGCRAKLLIIGTTSEMIQRLKDTLTGYGIDDISQFIVLDAKPENMFSQPYDPDWNQLENEIPELFCNCDSVGIVQAFPGSNGGRFEFTALRILEKHLTIPLTMAYEICNERDFLRICASTLLNARLIPLLTDFIKSVHNVMKMRGLNIPLSIVRSDGSLMSEEMAVTCPVETLLCGPASSIIGAVKLTHEKNAIVVDMGGTTTDLAMIVNETPILAKSGIHIGQYKTSMKGLNAKAYFLGGDSALRFNKDQLVLGTNKVIPISILATEYPTVLPELRDFVSQQIRHTRNIHEFLVLQKSIVNKSMFTDYENRACEVLAEKPMLLQEFAARMGKDVYSLGTERLEREGFIIRSGMTPTDMMVLMGDLTIYDSQAAEEMIKYAAFMTKMREADIPAFAYNLVIEKMYKTIGLFILQYQYPEATVFNNTKDSEFLLDAFYKNALAYTNDPDTFRANAAQMRLTTDMTLVGVGAPTHVFLPAVARLLGTKAIRPDYAYIANAVGAAACSLTTHFDVTITAVYETLSCLGYKFMKGQKLLFIEDLDDALNQAKEYAIETIKKRASFQGLSDNFSIDISIEEKRLGNVPTGLLLDIIVHACANGDF